MQKSFRIFLGALVVVVVVVALAGASCKRNSATIDANSLVGNSVFQGNVDAKVTIVEYSDYLCPACRLAHEVITAALAEYSPDEVRFAHKDFIIHGLEIAIAARCVQNQSANLFWQYFDYLFASQGNITAENILEKTRGLFSDTEGFDYPAFESCYSNQDTFDQVMADHDAGKELGVNSTPTFIINNRVIKGAPSSVEQFRKTIDELLAE